MIGNWLQRAVRVSRPVRGRVIVWLAGAALGLALPLLVVLVGLTTELLVDLDHERLQGDSVRLLGPGLVQLLSRSIVPGVDPRELSWLYALIGVIAVVVLMIAALVAILQRSAQWAALDVTAKLQSAIVQQATRLAGAGTLARRDPAEALLNEKCDQIASGLCAWWKASPAAIVMLAALAAVALLVNVSLTISVFSLIALTLLLLQWAVNQARLQRGPRETETASARRRVGEYLRQLPLAAGYTMNGPPAGDAQPLLARLRASLVSLRTADAWLLPLLLAFGGLAACFAALLAGMNVLRLQPGAAPLGDLTVAGIVVLESCLLAAIVPIVQLLRLGRNLSAAEASAAEVFAYLDRAPSVGRAPDARPVAPLAEKIELENVRLADRDGHLLLDDLTLAIPKGQRFAVMATDSQVPLALAGLLVRFYDPASGRVLWDGHDLRHADPATLRRQAVVVADDGLIFDGTVSQNIQCGNGDYTPLQLTDAAKLVRAYNFIQQLPQGFATPLGDGGRRLNPAQSFRVALARAAVREPSLIVVQEPAIAMDEADGALVDDAMRQLGAGRTLVILAARLETLRNADAVCLIHEGKLAAAGPHFGLLQSSTLYRHVNYMRYNEFGTAVR